MEQESGMTDKMREAFEKWALTECFDLTSVGGFYSDNETHTAYIAWQAAQSNCPSPEHIRAIKIPTDTMEQEFQTHYRRGYEAGKKSAAVPVVGEALFYASDSTPTAESQIQYDVCAYQKDYSFFPVYRKPATSITAAELERLQKNDARYRWLREQSWNASELCVVSQPKHSVKLGHDCPSYARLDEAIDAAIAGEKQ